MYQRLRCRLPCWSIRQNRNYGVKVTSRTEGSHASLRRHLKGRNGTLYQLNQAVKCLVDRQRIAYEEKASHQDRVPPAVKDDDLYRNVRGQVSVQSLRQVMGQHNQALESSHGQQLVFQDLHNPKPGSKLESIKSLFKSASDLVGFFRQSPLEYARL